MLPIRGRKVRSDDSADHVPMLLLLLTAFAVGVLHTMVPDHWAPIAVIARQRGWSRLQAARTAAGAGLGHTLSTLAIGSILWIAGVAFARRFGAWVNVAGSLALIGFGLWTVASGFRDLREHGDREHTGHGHLHRHEGGLEHAHWHEHHAADWHDASQPETAQQAHDHSHSQSSRTALLLILGSSPSIEALPIFFSSASYGPWFLIVVGAVFAAATMGTYAGLTALSLAGLQLVRLGTLERYGEVISGAFVVLIGLVFGALQFL